ncbi:Asparagine synthetase 3 [Hibiscus syriacus]|uniref:Asparagine synthetase [glutamine-hydrolyzing] n=1 Tax=Hibiscus syriacus TaxID=106335 RepID=A0A6A3AQF7_HIBSY|nr:Asparagine synthetase 3 [Hibiscus syriacus]
MYLAMKMVADDMTKFLPQQPPRAFHSITPTMCGILAVFGCVDNSQAKRSRIIELSRRLRHRGPDWSGLHCHQDCYLAHQRLAIVDPASGDQPLYNEDKTVVVTVNGEIYNHKQLKENLKSHQFRTGSDCEVIAHLYEEYGEDFVDMLDGMFSFVLLNTRDKSFIAARDAIGITPLYIGWGLDGSVWFASEMKALSDDCERFMSFLPGHIYSSKQGVIRRWYNPPWFSEKIPSTPYDPKAVLKRLMTDVPFGVLLSGGLDSSLVAAVAARYLAIQRLLASGAHSYIPSALGSPDLKAAREVADYIGTRHHEFHFTVQEGIDALEEVIYHIETYDVTTIRASTPMFLMSRKIKSLGVKMVLSGGVPMKSSEATCISIKLLTKKSFMKKHVERANKSTSAWGLEARVPFLDKEFINVAMSIDPEWKMIRPDLGRIEKWVLRNAFDDDQKPYLPKVGVSSLKYSCNLENLLAHLYRQKEQFSDEFGYSWIDGLKDHAENQVTDAMLMNASFIYPENTPTTKEDTIDYLREVFP